jgi:CheY-like chemotaxis protein
MSHPQTMPHPEDKRILLVDADSTLRMIRHEILLREGYGVYPAFSPADALSRCKPGAYELVLFSSNNEAEALEFCSEVRKLNPDQLVIVLSRPNAYIPPGSCPDEVVSDGPRELLARVDAALSAHG